MRAEKVINYLLLNDSGISARVGTRIYAVMAPQRELPPFIVYGKELANRTPTIHQGGPVVCTAIVSLQMITADYGSLKDLGEIVRVALIPQRGNIEGVDVLMIDIEQEGGDTYDPELRMFGQNWMYKILHSELLP